MENNIKIIPLGGFDKIGMNMILIEYNDSIIALDCGASFPPVNMPGITTLVPDVTYIKNNIDRFKGIILTHGHEDHIGAIPYVIKDLKAPIYGTPLTISLVEKKLKDFGIKGIKTKAIKLGSTIVVGCFKVEFIRTNHSIPDSAMLAVYTPKGVILNTGDFKLDLSPVVGKPSDIARLTALGTKGVLAVMSDSTNAVIAGVSRSELYVYEQLDKFFNLYNVNRLIIVTFASNMDRVQQIINLCRKYGRKIAMDGKLMMEVFSISRELGYIDVEDNILVDISDINSFSDEELVILTTGNHGESVQCIAGIADGNHKNVRIKKNDVVLFSSIAISGNEIEFNRTLDSLEEQGAVVEFQDIHATGHGCAGELKLLYSILKPKYVIPAHGEYRYRREAKRIATEVGINPKNIILISNGDVLEINEDGSRITGAIHLNEILIDGYEKSKVDTNILMERQRLSQSGTVIIEMCIDKNTGRYASELKIVSYGFAEAGRYPGALEKLKKIVFRELSRFVSQGVWDKRIIKSIQNVSEKFILEETGKTPIVIVLLTEVMI